MFDPDIKDRIRTTVEGQSGKRTLTYLVIPRTEGRFDIALPEMAYFDYAKKRFERLSLPPVTLNIESGGEEQGPAFGFNSKSDVTILTRDVRFIRTETELRPRTQPFFGGPLHLGMWALPPFALAAVGMWRRRKRKEEADPLSSRKKQARKQLKGVLAAAAKGEVGLDELGAAVHAFLQASLDIPRSEANRTRYESALNHLGGAELTQTWLAIVDTVDRGRFAPGAPQPADLASQVEAAMRALDSTQRGRPTGKATALLALCLTGMSLAAWGAPDPEAALTAFQSGNVAYTEGDYEGAIEATSVLDKWTSFELEYNLGGAHYKAGNIGPCILHYERARAPQRR